MYTNEITFEKAIKLKKEIMIAREQTKLLRRNGFFDLYLKKDLDEKKKELAGIIAQLNSRHAWRPL